MRLGGGLTIQIVSKLAGVSTATVSRVLNGKPGVSDETIETVRRVVSEHDGSQTFSFSEGGTILMCVSNLANPFNISVVNGAEQVAGQQGYDFLIIQSHNDASFSASLESLKKNHRFIGVITLAPIRNLQLISTINRYCPVVMCAEYVPNDMISYVSIDDYQAAKVATNHLLSCGRRKIALLNGSLEKKYSQNRENGFRDAMAAAGISVHEEWVQHIPSINYSLAYNAAAALLDSDDRPDAIFAISDVYALAAIHAVRRSGLSVPEDVSVIGFDNTETSLMSDPPITTMQQPAELIGAQACQLLLSQIRTPHIKPQQILLNTELILRESTSVKKD